jgi:hypothetical protein
MRAVKKTPAGFSHVYPSSEEWHRVGDNIADCYCEPDIKFVKKGKAVVGRVIIHRRLGKMARAVRKAK